MKMLWLRFGYRPWARLLHSMNLHHSCKLGPLEDGAFKHVCQWCGMSRIEYPNKLIP